MLSDPDSRRKYDAHGDQWKHADEIEAQRRAARKLVRASWAVRIVADRRLRATCSPGSMT